MVTNFTTQKRTKLGQGLFNIKSNIRSIIKGTPAQQGSLAGAVQTGVKKVKEHFKETSIGKIAAGGGFLESLKNPKTKLLDFPTKEELAKIDVNKLGSFSTVNDPEYQRIRDKVLNSAMIFGVGSLEAKAKPVIQKGVEIVKQEIKNSPVIQKLLNVLKEAKPARKELEKLQTIERSKRTGAVAEVLGRGEGEKGYFQALGKLKGELVPEEKLPKFEGLRGENKLSQEDVDELFKGIQQHPILDVYDKINASSGLMDLFEGQIPQKHKLGLLEETFGSDLIRGILAKRNFGQKLGDFAVDLLNVPRSLITSFDMSAPLRQGIIFTVTKPKQSIPAFGKMFQQFFSEKAFTGWLDNVKISPEYKLIKQSKLYVSDPTKISGGLSSREESFMSNIAERIPIIGRVVKASSRAYTGYLNKLRVDVFNDLSKKLIKDGMDPGVDEKVFTDLASFVNNATGRGSLGKMANAGAVMNNIFFSPRLIASRFNMLNPVWYAQKSPAVRKEAIKSMLQFIGFGSTVLTIAAAGGAEVELDPRSTDFGKIKVGNTRWDIWGGFQQWVRVAAQMISGQRKTAKGDIIDLSAKKFPFETRLDVGARFFRGKLAPVPSLALELMEGQKLFGEELTFSDTAIREMIPLYLQGMQEAIDDIGPSAALTVGIPAFFGVGTQTYQEKQKGLSEIWK